MLINEQIKWLIPYCLFSVTLNFMKTKPPKCTFNIQKLYTFNDVFLLKPIFFVLTVVNFQNHEYTTW